MDEKSSNGGQEEVMSKLFMMPVSREICRNTIIIFGLIVFLLLPLTLTAQDVPDLKRKAEQGDAHSQVDLGLLYENGKGVPGTIRKQSSGISRLPSRVMLQARNNLGLMSWNGKGVPRDYNEAVKWYRKAADQGNVYGQNNLGDAYRDGKGVPRTTTRPSSGGENLPNKAMPMGGETIWALCTRW